MMAFSKRGSWLISIDLVALNCNASHMPTPKTGQELLETAYTLATPADNVAYYRDAASAYDNEFAAGLGYDYPRAIAQAYLDHARVSDVPIADIGCGTGCVAKALEVPPEQIDGFDISPEMLAIAQAKALYRSLTCVDITGPLSAIAHGYGAVLSAGTFTHGHLGPGPLRSLLGLARRHALFIIGVNRAHFDKAQFGQTLDELQASGKITTVKTHEVNIYTRPGHAHSDDVALILIYRKLSGLPGESQAAK